MERIRADIRDFRRSSGVDKVIVLWTANTERFCELVPGVSDTAKNLLAGIQVMKRTVHQVSLCTLAWSLQFFSSLHHSFSSGWSSRDISLHSVRRGQHTGGLRLHQRLSTEHLRPRGHRAGHAERCVHRWRRLQVWSDQNQVGSGGFSGQLGYQGKILLFFYNYYSKSKPEKTKSRSAILSLFHVNSQRPSLATITLATTTGRTCLPLSSSAPRRFRRAT